MVNAVCWRQLTTKAKTVGQSGQVVQRSSNSNTNQHCVQNMAVGKKGRVGRKRERRKTSEMEMDGGRIGQNRGGTIAMEREGDARRERQEERRR